MLQAWLGAQRVRVILLDQRGTEFAPHDSANQRMRSVELTAPEYIVEDSSAAQVFEHRQVVALCQSFGGFCMQHLSRHPESVEHPSTGGLPTLEKSVDDLYRTTLPSCRYATILPQYPWAEDRIREICAHLEDSAEILPTGERLSATLSHHRYQSRPRSRIPLAGVSAGKSFPRPRLEKRLRSFSTLSRKSLLPVILCMPQSTKAFMAASVGKGHQLVGAPHA